MKKLNLTISLCAIFMLFFAGINGDNNPNQFNCVGSLLKSGKDDGPCVLIGKKYVLVPASCLIDDKTKPAPLPGTSITTFTSYDQKVTNVKNLQIEFNGKLYACKKIVLYPVFNMKKGEDCNLAIIKLQDDVQGVDPASVYTNFDEQQVKVLEISSVKETSTQANPENLIDSLGGYNLNGKPTVLYGNLNMPIIGDINKIASEGMLFTKTTNGWQLTGLIDGSQYEFSSTGDMRITAVTWTRVSVFADWIKKTTTE